VDPLRCGRCDTPRDIGDNFCRRCGHQLTVNLPALSRAEGPALSRVEGPAVRPSRLPAARRAIPPSLIGSVAVLALGTGLEWLARRAAGSAAKAAGRALVSSQERLPARPSSTPPRDVSVDEVLYVRKVQLRR